MRVVVVRERKRERNSEDIMNLLLCDPVSSLSPVLLGELASFAMTRCFEVPVKKG